MKTLLLLMGALGVFILPAGAQQSWTTERHLDGSVETRGPSGETFQSYRHLDGTVTTEGPQGQRWETTKHLDGSIETRGPGRPPIIPLDPQN